MKWGFLKTYLQIDYLHPKQTFASRIINNNSRQLYYWFNEQLSLNYSATYYSSKFEPKYLQVI